MSQDINAGRGEMLRAFGRRWWTPITVALTLVLVTTAVLWPIHAELNQDHLIFIYLVPTSLVAIRYGSISAMCVAIASSFAAAYFLYPPPFSFLVGSSLELMELTLFCLLALLASQVVSGFASDSEVAKRNDPPARRSRRATLWSRML